MRAEHGLIVPLCARNSASHWSYDVARQYSGGWLAMCRLSHNMMTRMMRKK